MLLEFLDTRKVLIKFTGQLTLLPMSVAPVCRAGDPLQLTCTASVEFLRWNILRANEQGTLVDVINREIINSRDDYRTRNTPLDSSVIIFMRISDQEDSPLVSALSIDSVNIALNGTVVNCTDLANPMTSVSTAIQIIDTSQSESTNIKSLILKTYISSYLIYTSRSPIYP
ncbi:MAG: hypothetical protein MJE68_21195 [Proteobacteria bacterium]|nr:hypothetical protein [Pseudomonadota bacterium]